MPRSWSWPNAETCTGFPIIFCLDNGDDGENDDDDDKICKFVRSVLFVVKSGLSLLLFCSLLLLLLLLLF